MTNNTKHDDKKSASKASSIMRSKETSHEEKSRVASQLGKKGAGHAHKASDSK